jgi:hypothetical protein
MDGRTDVTKLIVAFRNFANAPDNWMYLCCLALNSSEASRRSFTAVLRSSRNGGVITFLGAFAKLRKATISFVMPVCLRMDSSAPTGRIFDET